MAIKKLALLFLLILLIFGVSFAQVNHTKRKASNSSSPSLLRGKVVYTNICLACHMADGGGVQNMNPPLIKTTYVSGDKTTLIKIVLNGFKEDVEIDGKTYANNMTPHSDLKDQQIADVLTYVRKSFGNRASAVSVAQVKMVRAANEKK